MERLDSSNLSPKLKRSACSYIRHEGPVWRIVWAHPALGNIFASCSFDGTVKVWINQGQKPGPQWDEIYAFDGHDASGKRKIF